MWDKPAIWTSRPVPRQAVSQRTWVPFTLIAAASAGLRLHLLGSKSIWIDEAVSVTLAQASWTDFWKEVSSYEGNMVFYYLLLRG